MKVRALELGFHGGKRRHPGDVFSVPDGSRGKWFEVIEKAEAPAPKPSRTKAAAKPDPVVDEGAGDLV